MVNNDTIHKCFLLPLGLLEKNKVHLSELQYDLMVDVSQGNEIESVMDRYSVSEDYMVQELQTGLDIILTMHRCSCAS